MSDCKGKTIFEGVKKKVAELDEPWDRNFKYGYLVKNVNSKDRSF